MLLSCFIHSTNQHQMPSMKKHSLLFWLWCHLLRILNAGENRTENFLFSLLISSEFLFVCVKWNGSMGIYRDIGLLLVVTSRRSSVQIFGTNVCINYDVRTSAIDWQSNIYIHIYYVANEQIECAQKAINLNGNLWLWLCVAYFSTTGDDFGWRVHRCSDYDSYGVPASFHHTINIWLNGRHWTHDRFTIQHSTSPTPSLYRIKSIKQKSRLTCSRIFFFPFQTSSSFSLSLFLSLCVIISNRFDSAYFLMKTPINFSHSTWIDWMNVKCCFRWLLDFIKVLLCMYVTNQ